MINYNDPRYQNALLNSIARKPYGGIRSNSAITSKWAEDQTRQGLALSSAYSADKFRQAAIQNMDKNYDIAKARVGIEKDRTKIGWGDIDIGRKRIGLGERQLGLEGQRIGLADRYADLAFGQEHWRKDFTDNRLEDEENAMWLATALGIGTTGFTAYETSRRRELDEQERRRQREWMDRYR